MHIALLNAFELLNQSVRRVRQSNYLDKNDGEHEASEERASGQRRDGARVRNKIPKNFFCSIWFNFKKIKI